MKSCRGRPDPRHVVSGIVSASASQAAGEASAGMRQSPRGDSEPPEPDLRPVRHAVALELVGEEPAQEHQQPLPDVAERVAILEGGEGESRDAARSEAEAQQLVEEEVVQLVGADEVLRALARSRRPVPAAAARG